MGGFRNVKFFSRKCDDRILEYDEACLNVYSERNVTVLRQYLECDGCDYVKRLDVGKGFSGNLLFKTVSPVKYKIVDSDNGREVCDGVYAFKEYGKYGLNVTGDGCSDLVVTDQPDEALLPLLVAIVMMLLVATFWYLFKAAYKRLCQMELWNRIFRRGESGEELLGSPSASSRGRSSTRLHSADVFRGMTIATMILVNYGGGGYSWMRHAPWDGLTLADVVFPCFAWLMGLSLCLALHTRLRTAMTRWSAFLQVVTRSFILVCLGVVLGPDGRTIEEMRLPGVLQRLGLAYLIVGSVECFSMSSSTSYSPGTSLFRDLRTTWFQWTVTVCLAAVQVCVSLLLQVPGCPRGYLGPGGLHNGSHAANCTGGAASYIDRMVLGEGHMYKGGSYKHLYETTVPMDPEGLLGTLTCVLVVQLGVQAGRVLLAYSHARARLSRWLIWGALCLVGAGALCNFSQHGGLIPINKNLWSLSYCLATSGIAFITQAFLYKIVDISQAWGGRPFYYAGRNALLIYVGHELMKDRFPFEWRLQHPSHMQLLAMNALGVLLWLAIAKALHTKQVLLTL